MINLELVPLGDGIYSIFKQDGLVFQCSCNSCFSTFTVESRIDEVVRCNGCGQKYQYNDRAQDLIIANHYQHEEER